MANNITVGATATLKADPVLGSVAEPVKVIEITGATAWVEQLTRANGEPGTFPVNLADLSA